MKTIVFGGLDGIRTARPEPSHEAELGLGLRLRLRLRLERLVEHEARVLREHEVLRDLVRAKG